MNANWKSKDGKVSVEFEVNDVVDLVKQVYALNQVEDKLSVNRDTDLFENLAELGNRDTLKVEVCGKCKSGNVTPRVREVDGDKYYEMICLDCWAKLPFGCHRQGGGLFAKRRDDEKKMKGVNGWVKFNKEKGVEE